MIPFLDMSAFSGGRYVSLALSSSPRACIGIGSNIVGTPSTGCGVFDQEDPLRVDECSNIMRSIGKVAVKP